jgi:oligopeptide/dipeptide ABC transporter ATP-binding protein
VTAGHAPAAVASAGPAAAISIRGLTVTYGGGRRGVSAVQDVTVNVGAGETFAIIGESGSGKSTLLKAIAGLVPPAAGTVEVFSGSAGGARRGAARGQVVFQDPDRALDPRQPIWKSVAEPLVPRQLRIPASLRETAIELLSEVGLGMQIADRRPHEISGGQKQRVTIARALASRAPLILLDEPVSAQDVSLQASLLRLLMSVQRERGLTYVIVSHDVAAVAGTADRVAVMYAAKLVEIGAASQVLTSPLHPYTRALIAAVPRITAERAARPAQPILGEPPDPRIRVAGCRFRSRCPFAIQRCASEEPALQNDTGAGGHQVACHRWQEISEVTASTSSAPKTGREPR